MQRVITRFEIAFWNWYIPCFSQSPLLKKLIPWVYQVSRRQMLTTYLAAVCVISSGFLTGMILFYVTNK